MFLLLVAIATTTIKPLLLNQLLQPLRWYSFPSNGQYST